MATEQMNKQGMTRDTVDKTCETCVCGECDAELTQVADRSTSPLSWVVVCARDRSHEGYKPVQGAVELAVQYGGGPAYLNQGIAKRSPVFAGATDNVIMQRLITQYGLSPYQAAAGLIHAQKLGLDPFLNQIAFLTFRRGGGEQKDLAPMVTEKGWAYLANLHEPDEFMGMPTVKPMTPEEKVAFGWEEDDVAYIATMRKRSWVELNHSTEVAARVSKKEIMEGRAGSRPTPLAEDPHQHCRTRVIRRAYEQNYPRVLQTIGAAIAEDSEITAVIEGKYRDVPAESQDALAPSADVPMSDWATRCPEHGDDWREGQFGPFHPVRGGGICDLKKLLKPLVGAAAKAIDLSQNDINERLKKTHDGKTLSKLEGLELLELLQQLTAAAEAKADDEDEPDNPADSNAPVVDDDGVIAGDAPGLKDWSDLCIAAKSQFDKEPPDILGALGKTDSSEVTDYGAAFAELTELWGA